jgi:CspA family cold shock protein
LKGTVKWYNAKRSYGFIEGEDGTDVFVHRTAIPMGVFLREGDIVEFETEDSDRGLKAVNVRKL